MSGLLGWHTARLTLQGWLREFRGSAGQQVTRAMEQNVHVYRGVSVIAQTIAGLPLVLRRGGEGDPLEGGPAHALLNQPDEGMTWADLAEEIAGHLVVSGAAFLLDPRLIGEQALGDARRRLVCVGQDQMIPEYAAGSHRELLWWWFEDGVRRLRIVPEAAPYLRLFNPYEPWLGLSPLRAAALGIQQDYKAAHFNVAALDNGGQPGGIYLFDQLTEEQQREFQKRIEQRHSSPGNANRPLVTAGLRDYKTSAFNMVDLALLDSRRLSREEILEALGVPPVLANVFDAAHYNVADAAQEIFLLNTIVPLVGKIVGLLNVLILPQVEAGVEAELDLSTHHVMQRIEWRKLEQLERGLRSGVPYNELVRDLGLPYTEQKWGDTALLAAGLQTADDVIAGVGVAPELPFSGGVRGSDDAGEEAASDETPERDEADLAVAMHAAVAQELREDERLVRAAIPEIRGRFRAYFARQERDVARRLRKEVRGQPSEIRTAGLHVAAKEERAEEIARRIVMNVISDQSALRGMVAAYFPRHLEASLRAALQAQGLPAEQVERLVASAMRGRLVQRLLAIKEIRVAQIEQTTRRRLQATLVKGLRAGETVGELAGRVHEVLGGAMSRALLIARTEAGQAVSSGRFVAAQAAGATHKGWLHGANPRGSHLQAQQDYHPRSHPIPIDEAFRVGTDRLMFPRDPSGSPGEIINCNCVMVTRTQRRRPA